MTNQASTRVRLVRCPKCHQVLAELPEVTLYKCGGCGTVLQAKKRKVETNQAEQALETKETVVKAEHDDALGEKEATSSNGNRMNCQAGEASSSKTDVECEGEHQGISSVSKGSSTSSYVSCCNESEDSTAPGQLPVGQNSQEKAEERNGYVDFSSSGVGKESTTEDSRKQLECMNQQQGDYLAEKESISHELSYPARASLVDETEEKCEDEQADSPVTVELNEDSSISNRLSTSTEVNSSESEDSPAGINSLEGAEGSGDLDEIHSSSEENMCLVKEDSRKHDEFTNEHAREDEHKENDLPPVEKDETTQMTPAYKDGDFLTEITQDGAHSSSVEIISQENGDASPNIELRIAVYGDDDTDEDLSALESPRTETESPQIGSERSVDTVVDPVTPDKDLSTRTEKEQEASVDNSIPPQSATKGSIITQCYSVSPDSERHGSVSSVETLESLPPDVRSSELGVTNCEMTNSSITQNYYGYDGGESSCDGMDYQIQENVSRPPLRKSGDVNQPHISAREIPVRHRFRVNDMVNSDQEMNRRRPSASSILQVRQHHSMKDKFVEAERVPFASREFEVDHRTSNPLVHHHNRLPPHPGFHSNGKHSYSVPDKMDLLRTVCELKEQLDRMQFPKRLPTRVVNERSSPHYYAHLPPEMELYGDSNPRRVEWINHHRPAFSGEVAHYRHQANCSCLQCYPQDRCYSAQLPPQSTFLSTSSSPQQYLSSEISWGRETSFDDQRQRDEEIKRLYLKEKYHTAKRNLRPIAGGAPVLTCYHCSELLLLPEDFLMFEKKRYHQLRCNACNQVLKLSRREKTHIVPYVPDSPAPPPSEAESVLLSDEYGRSYNRYPSMGGDPSTALPQNGVAEQQKDRKMKSILKQSHSKSKSLMGTVESAGPSSMGTKMRKPSSEIIEERPALHRLMGYTSLSQVFEK